MLTIPGGSDDAVSHTSETVSATTTKAGDLAITLFYPRTAGSEASFTPQGGWTNLGKSLTTPYTSDWQIAGAAGALSETESWPTASNNNRYDIMAFKPAAAGAGNCPGGITRIQTSPTATYTGGLTVSLPAPSTVGNLVVISWATHSSTALSAPSGSWTGVTLSSGGVSEGFFYLSPIQGLSVQTVTFGCLAACSAQISEWSNVSGGIQPRDQMGSGADLVSHVSETAATSGPTTIAGDLAMTNFYPAAGSAETFTPGAGWTNLGNSSSTPLTTDYELAVPVSTPTELEQWNNASTTNDWDIVAFKNNGSAIAKVQASALIVGSATSLTATLGTASTAGTLLVAFVVGDSAGSPSVAAGWTAAGIVNDGTAVLYAEYYYNNPGGITSVALPCGAATKCYARISEWSGVQSSSDPLDYFHATGDVTAHTSETISTTTFAAGDLVIDEVFAEGAAAPTFTPGAGWTNVGASSAVPDTTDSKVAGAAGAVSETLTWNNASTNDVYGSMAFLAAGAGGGPSQSSVIG